MNGRIRTSSGVAMLALAVVGAGCGSDEDAANPDSNGEIGALTVSLTSNGCAPDTLNAAAGDITFSVRNDVTDSELKQEFEILTAEPKILAEEFFEKGEGREVGVTLPAGEYQLICGASSAPRSTLIVTGDGGQNDATLKVDPAALQANVDEYTQYVNGQLSAMVTSNKALNDAIDAGDLELARSLYMPSRVQWERIEPIAELFPDSDAAMDSRADDFEQAEQDPNFTGWHRLEYLMFDQNTLAGAPRFADQLISDIDNLITSLGGIDIDAATMVNGSAALIEEAANGKITGEEERYAKTDLVTLAANVEGARVIVDINAELLEGVDSDLYHDIITRFDAIDAGLAAYDNGDGTYKPYDQLTDADRQPLQAELAALSENLAKIAGSFGLEVA
jgi:iron uptake system component EfeO